MVFVAMYLSNLTPPPLGRTDLLPPSRQRLSKTKVTSSDDHANGSDQFYYPPYPAVLGSSVTSSQGAFEEVS